MKTVSRMVRRYMIAAFAIVLVVVAVNAGLWGGFLIRYGFGRQEGGYYPISRFAESFDRRADGTVAPAEAEDWQAHFDWAMLLDDGGRILWSKALPQELDHAYTVPEVASFSRWYLLDYPVKVYRNSYGLVVAGLPVGSVTRYNLYIDNEILEALFQGFVPLLILDAGLILLICLLMGWLGAKPLRALAEGIDHLAKGEPVQLQQKGATAELAMRLNEAGRHLQKQARLIEQRDAARTGWIAGVSHDIRTPLSLIMGYAEQLEAALTDSAQQGKAAAIRAQSMRIRTLIEDLNLTSKLQYDAQPLRLREVQIGPWLRDRVASFCNALEEVCEVEVSVSEAAGRLCMSVDDGLLQRALENLLSNSVRHAGSACTICVSADVQGNQLRLCVQDDGAGYPDAVLRRLDTDDAAGEAAGEDNAPHILGLHLVQQIVRAHGGSVRYENAEGARAEICLPIPAAP